MAAAVLGALAPAPLGAAEALVPLARPGPWPELSGLIGFDSRLWFVNGVKYRNHNSADVYSYDPARGGVRYEAHLFSQDAGHPAVAGGRLYWPFEDPRFTTGRGEYMVTDGRRWRWRRLPDGEVFHIHAMIGLGRWLYAATAAWRAGLQRSGDGGATWRIIYDRPTAEGQVTRLTALAVLRGALFAGLTDRHADGIRLLRLDGDDLVPVAGWPLGRRVGVLAAHRGRLYGVNVTANGSAVWRWDGEAAERVAALDGARVRALASGPAALWAVTGAGGKGRLWRSVDGLSWEVVQRFDHALPIDVAVYGGRVYVGSAGPNGRGTLWGPPPPAPVEPSTARPLPPRRAAPPAGGLAPALAALDRALADRESYARYGEGLRAALRPFAEYRAPAAGAALSQRLAGPFPDLTITMFDPNFVVTATEMAQWGLLWAIAHSGHGRVPPSLLRRPWRAIRNDTEKYMEPAPAAAWAVARLGQDDDETLAALVDRLDAPGDPPWLRGDIIGALTALTGQRFGYDLAAWRRWWQDHRSMR